MGLLTGTLPLFQLILVLLLVLSFLSPHIVAWNTKTYISVEFDACSASAYRFAMVGAYTYSSYWQSVARENVNLAWVWASTKDIQAYRIRVTGYSVSGNN